eukprot:NODE_900_length_2260_cov_32.866168_g767_i0.p1 GENE.NODE_900_length_2260_cov_32.866168_g767_i0~~NODE_900_length_2260_cov_32.866168_g767_i0.p1  ORF type:complete len:749 (+),score=111.22 NODE_900_length_2260_cov_32.866168_g767_i0:185-2248(+)
MYVNYLAGRTPNDLNQYPVFPWILKNYDSSILNLQDQEIYRDLSKPIGTQDTEYSKKVMERYNNWCDPNTAPFHHGTHYSSPGIVLHYLLRMQPYSSMSVYYQGGKLDLADRLLYSLKAAWECTSSGSVKELIPELFYLPHCLVNINKADLGVRVHTGEPLGDVLLPPWCDNDAATFIKIHREALEGDYVSSHLHEWIDLIFGYKQQGPEAEKSLNVFHHLTYENGVMDALHTAIDDSEREAIMSQISHFGCCPAQVFFQPHSVRYPRSNPTSPTAPTKSTFRFTSPTRRESLSPTPSDVSIPDDVSTLKVWRWDVTANVVMVRGPKISSQNRTPSSSSKWKSVGSITITQSYAVTAPPLVVWIGNQNQYYLSFAGFVNHARLYNVNDQNLIAELNIALEDITSVSSVVASPINETIFIGSDCGVIHITKLELGSGNPCQGRLSLIGRLVGHVYRVTLLLLSTEHCLLVSCTENLDDPPILWHISLQTVERIAILHKPGLRVTCGDINPNNGDILLCGSTDIFIWNRYGTGIATICLKSTLEGGDTITAVSFIRCTGYSGTVHIFATGHQNGSIRFHRYDSHRKFLYPGADATTPLNPIIGTYNLKTSNLTNTPAQITTICPYLLPSHLVLWHTNKPGPASPSEVTSPSLKLWHLYCGHQEGGVVCFALPFAILNTILPYGSQPVII